LTSVTPIIHVEPTTHDGKLWDRTEQLSRNIRLSANWSRHGTKFQIPQKSFRFSVKHHKEVVRNLRFAERIDKNFLSQMPAGVRADGVAGVTLRFLQEFCQENNIDSRMSCADICKGYIMKQTNRNGIHSPLVVMIGERKDSSGKPYVGTPTQFLSYTWSHPISVVLGVLEKFEHDNPGKDHFFFIDMFCLDQHVMIAHSRMDQSDFQRKLVATLQNCIRIPNHVLVCLHPFHEPLVLSRSWCLFELFTAMGLEAKISMCFSKEDAESFFDALDEQRFDAKSMVMKIHASTCEATDPRDKEMILNEINKVGVRNYNRVVRNLVLSQFNMIAIQRKLQRPEFTKSGSMRVPPQMRELLGSHQEGLKQQKMQADQIMRISNDMIHLKGDILHAIEEKLSRLKLETLTNTAAQPLYTSEKTFSVGDRVGSASSGKADRQDLQLVEKQTNKLQLVTENLALAPVSGGVLNRNATQSLTSDAEMHDLNLLEGELDLMSSAQESKTEF